MRPPILNPLFADVTTLPGVGPKLALLVARAAGPRVIDLILTLPTGVIDRSARPKIADAPFGALATLEVRIDKHDPPRSPRLPYRVICSDETGFITLIFFRGKPDYLKRALPEGETRLISGKIEEYAGARQMTHPDHIADPKDPDAMPLFEAVYPLTQGLTANVMRKAVGAAVARAPRLSEWQDAAWIKRQDWLGWNDALKMAHSPTSTAALSALQPARQRVAYDELLANQLALALIRRVRMKSIGRSIVGDGTLRAKVRKSLPFKLTEAQENALKEINADMEAPERMVRLLQGDVGSGKTIVAFLAMLNAVEAGAQAALMAPTEILARQHFETLSPLAEAAGVSLEIVTGRDKGAARSEKLGRIASGEAQIVLGTHALFQEDVAYKELGFIIVDEQHRFGVHQRMALSEKGPRPDMLVMTATPIPRTLALAVYGDMEMSAIREKPPGRKPVTTRAVPVERIEEVIAGVKRAAEAGEQIYWVCPLVEESELVPLTAAEDRYNEMRERFGDRVGLVHGRMSGAEKDAVMEKFHERELSVLIATTVIEVGVNAPNATIMVIEHAEHFGLAQLHQLRGRVGRGVKPASCILLYKGPLGETAKARLSILRETEDGFRIAEEDLRLRGAGDVLGAAQSGFPEFRIADIAAHGELLAAARDDARLIIEKDPELKSERGEALRCLLYLFSRDDAVRLIRSG
ncbi:MAG TPA: ATP-dependent DNA helicase RecG [Parvularculaceae bacterium]|nr:ATP-dependent DNA helicase RecG [Parvularculaceae bacterium]